MGESIGNRISHWVYNTFGVEYIVSGVEKFFRAGLVCDVSRRGGFDGLVMPVSSVGVLYSANFCDRNEALRSSDHPLYHFIVILTLFLVSIMYILYVRNDHFELFTILNKE